MTTPDSNARETAERLFHDIRMCSVSDSKTKPVDLLHSALLASKAEARAACGDEIARILDEQREMEPERPESESRVAGIRAALALAAEVARDVGAGTYPDSRPDKLASRAARPGGLSFRATAGTVAAPEDAVNANLDGIRLASAPSPGGARGAETDPEKLCEAIERYDREREDAASIADRVLDEPNADPDDNLRVLARQFRRAREREFMARDVIRKLRQSAPDA